MSLELPRGLTSRPATPADARAMFDLAAVCERDSDGVADVDEDDLVAAFGRHGYDPSLDSLLVFDRDELVGWADLYRQRAEADVRPTHRGRGIGTTLLRWSETRAAALGAREVGQTTSDANVAARDLFLSNGYEPSWVSWFIRIALDETLSPADPPAGISIRPYRDVDAGEVHRLIDAAFSEWPGRGPEPFEVWASQVLRHPAFSAELSPLAFDGNELVGVVIADDYPDLGEGWIQQLATKPTHRRRGIAQALLRTAFGWFRERGRTVAGVSTDSRTGALGLYEKVGMRVERLYTRYRKRLEPEAAGTEG